jgi:hypothetical protein
MKNGIKAIIATTTECDGPLCSWAPVNQSKIMSASGIIERTINNGILILTRNFFEEPLPKR